MITIGDAMDYIEGLVMDNASLLDAPIQDFVIQDEEGNEFVIRLEPL